jgi:hypothetical protein
MPSEDVEQKEAVGSDVPRSVWIRWDMPDRYPLLEGAGAPIDYLESIKFHNFCPIFPLDSLYEDRTNRPKLRLASGALRLFIRHILWIPVVLGAAGLLISAVDSRLTGPWAFFPPLSAQLVALLGLLVASSVGILILLRVAGLTQTKDLFRLLFVYGPISLLLIGTLFTIYVTNFNPALAAPNNVIYLSGYLLAIAVLGPFAYDTLVRAESLLSNFGHKRITDKTSYAEFRREMRSQINSSYLGVPVSVAFAVLLICQFSIIWWYGQGPQGLNSVTLLLINAGVNFLLLIVVYKFTVIVLFAHKALMDEYQTSSGTLELNYRPLHPDGYGGFHDIGKAAMRVNLLIILFGMYFIYRLVVIGNHALPSNGFAALSQAETVTWIISYIGPLILYTVVVFCWIYFAFWQLHVKMANAKRRKLTEFHNRRRADALDSENNTASAPPPVGDPETGHDWQDVYNAPEWPVGIRPLASLITANFAPLALAFLNFVL